jgi:hypothetical protein
MMTAFGDNRRDLGLDVQASLKTLSEPKHLTEPFRKCTHCGTLDVSWQSLTRNFSNPLVSASGQKRHLHTYRRLGCVGSFVARKKSIMVIGKRWIRA